MTLSTVDTTPTSPPATWRGLIPDGHVLGLVGPLQSTVAQALIPAAAAAHLAMVSPAATDECLTRDLPPPECGFKASDLRGGKPNNFFRLAATVDEQGLAMAGYARHQLVPGQAGRSLGQQPLRGPGDEWVRDGLHGPGREPERAAEAP